VTLRQTVFAGRVRDAIAEHLHVCGDHRAAGVVVMIPADLLLRSEAHVRKAKTPLLQPAFERHARDLVRELKAMKARDLAAGR